MLYAVGALLAAIICGPLFGGHLLVRDAVSVPRFNLTAAAFGIDGSAPRAVPQDAVLGVMSQVVDGGLLVAALTTAAVFGSAVGFGRLAQRLVPAAGRAGGVAGAVVGVWNPFVAERLLQGHWSLLLGYAALGPIVCAVLDLDDEARPRWRVLLRLGGLFAVAGFTPTGSLLAAAVAGVSILAVRPSLRTGEACGALWLLSAGPWLVGAAVSTAGGSSGGAELFAMRAEPGLGSLGTALGLGGIWNADAVPASRTWWWALVATVLFVALVGAGAVALRRLRSRIVTALAVLAAAVVLLVAVAATGPGLAVMDALLAHVPGAGLLRDSQKYLALAVPFAAVAAAAVVDRLRVWVPGGFAVAGVLLLVAAPLPDLAWGVGGQVRTVSMPDDYARAVDVIGDDRSGVRGSVAVWPADTVRRLSWTAAPSLSPLPRMVQAPVVSGNGLVVDGRTVDAPVGRSADIVDVLADGGDRRRLADLGVGWVIVEEAPTPTALAATDPVFRGPHLSVYRVADAAPAPQPGTSAWVFAITATSMWALLVLGGVLGAAAQSRLSKTSTKPSAVDSHE